MRVARLRTRRSGTAIVVSLAVHAVVLAALVMSIRLPPPIPETPAVQVSLIDLTPTPRPRVRIEPPKPRPLTPRPAAAPPVEAPPPALRGTAERAPAGPSPAAPERGERGPFMNFYQDNLKGCEKEALILLPPADQERCRARIAAASIQKGRPFRADAPPIEALSGLSAARRAELDEEVARRARNRGPGRSPVTTCDGPRANLGAGCLPDPTD